jgi:pSer/pThr/pTyr-binding forkhead associated (FHA) protein
LSARLVWAKPGGEPVEFALDGSPVEVGRDEDAPVRIDEALVSRRHARIERRGEAWFVVDLDSTNFTRVNGRRIRREHELEDGDELRFARARCVFRVCAA